MSNLKIDVINLKVLIETDETRKKMEALQTSFKETKTQIKSLETQYKKGKISTEKYNNEMARLKKIAVENREDYEKLRDKISLTGMSLKELAQYQSELNMLLKQIPGDYPEYKMYAKRLQEVNSRMKEMRTESSATQSTLGKLGDKVGKYSTIIMGVVASVMGAVIGFRKLALEYAAMDDVYADVMKTTDMTKDQVLDLNEAFKKIDTRTSREEMNKLANEAGLLGLKSKKDILGFVKAGDQINVALGDVLGDGAIKNVGKLVGIFEATTKELQGKDLEQRMLMMGSALNELGKTSVANEGYILEFTSRLGGVAKQAGLSAQNVMGFASALDQAGLNVEMSATAVQKMINTIMKDTTFFAKMIGMPLKEFAHLLDTDVNSALLAVLSSMKDTANYRSLSKMISDASLDSERATAVLSTLAGSIDKIVDAQSVANKAFADGTSVTMEFMVKNDTLQARLDKLSKSFKDVSLELGEKLYPILEQGVKGFTNMVKAMSSVINFCYEYRAILIPLVTAITTYIVAIKLASIFTTLWSNAILIKNGLIAASRIALLAWNVVVALCTGGINSARIAWIAFSNALKVSPIGLIIAALATLLTTLLSIKLTSAEATKSLSSLAEVEKSVGEAVAEEEAKIKTLTSMIHNQNLSNKVRIEAINTLKSIIPGYNAMLDSEGRVIRENTDAIDKYISKLKEEARAKALKDKLVELYKKRYDEVQNEQDAGRRRSRAEERGDSDAARANLTTQSLAQFKISDIDDDINTLTEELSKKEMHVEAPVVLDFAYKTDKNYKKDIDAAKTEFDSTIQNAWDKVKNKQLDYGDYLKLYKESLYNQYDKITGANNKVYVSKNTNNGSTDSDRNNKDPYQEDSTNLDNWLDYKKLELLKSYQEGKITETEYKDAEIEADREFYNKKIALSDKYISADSKNQSKYAKYKVKAETDLYKTLAEKDRNTYELKKKNYENTIKIFDASELAEKQALEARLSSGELTQEEYDSTLVKIEKRYAIIRLEIAEKFRDDINDMEFNSQIEKQKIIKDANDEVIALDTSACKARIKVTKDFLKEMAQNEKARKDFLAKYGNSKKFSDTDIILNQLDEQYNAVMANEKLTADQRLELEKTYQKAKNIIVADGAAEAARAEREIGRNSIKSNYKLRIAELQKLKAKEEITEKEYNQGVKEAKIAMAKEYFDMYIQAASELISSVKEAEISNIEAEYDAKIAAAEDGSEEQQQLEEEKEAKIKEVKKKYADVEFAIKASEIIANTAVAIMSALKIQPGGAILAAIIGATGVAQLAIANSEREKIKGYKTGGYTDTDTSDNKVAGVTHANEFVATARAVRNPSIKKMLDIVDWAQRTGQEHLINTTDIVRKLMGGILPATTYPDPRKTTGSNIGKSQPPIYQSLEKSINKLNRNLENGIYAEANINIAGNNGLARKQARYNSLRSNARRTWRSV